MPFIQTGIRKNKKDLPVEEVETTCDVLSDLLIDKNRKAIKVFCQEFAKRFVSDTIEFDFSSSHTKLGHSIKTTGKITVNGAEYEEKRQTPYYSEMEYDPKDAGRYVFRDLVHSIMSISEKLGDILVYNSVDGFRDMEQAIFEILREDI